MQAASRRALRNTRPGMLLVAAVPARADTQVMSAPALEYRSTGWPGTGLRVSALQDIVLTSVVFRGFGASGTITMANAAGMVLGSVVHEGGSVRVGVQWRLIASSTYHLVSTDPDNSQCADAALPVASPHIRVDGGYQDRTMYPEYWFHFKDLTTVSSTVAETRSSAMWLAGLGLLGTARGRRSRQHGPRRAEAPAPAQR